jgi:uncharacterized protein (TIGR02246 family)
VPTNVRHSTADGNWFSRLATSSLMPMTGRILSCLGAIAVLECACAGRGSTGRRSESAREAIPVIYKTMEDAFQKGDAEVIAQAYTEDAEWYVPETPVIKGRPAIARAWKANVGSGRNRLRIEVAEVEQNGDRAHEVGRFTISGPDGAVLSAGKHMVLWARQPDGAWKTRRDIFNWDIPPRQPAATTGVQ